MSDVPLHGEFHLRLDLKSRLTLPRELREQIAATNSTALIPRVSAGLLEPAVWLFADHQYDALCAKHNGAEDVVGFDLRMFELEVPSRLAIDRRGRVTLPGSLLSHYSIYSPEVALIGVDNHFELWALWRWEEHRAALLNKPLRPS